jgi:O-antigen/teichoic acid export membrane protein
MSDGPSSSDRAVEAGRGALFIGFAKVFFMVAGTVWNFLLIRLVGAADVGRFSVVNNVVSTVNNTMVQGTIQSVSKFTAEDDKQIDTVKRAGLVMQSFVGVGAALVFVLGAPLFADFANAPGYVGWFRLAGAIPLIYAFYAVFVGSANGQRLFRLQATFDVLFSIMKATLLLGGAVIGRSTGHAVTGAFLGFIAAAILILVFSGTKIGLPKGEARFPASRLMAFMAGALAYTFLLNVALNICDSYLLRRFAGAVVEQVRADAIVGHYQGLRNLGLLPYQALLVITFVIFPLISRSTFVEDRESTRLYISQTLRYYAIMIGAALAVVLAARPAAIIAILYSHDPEYLEGARALPVLVAGVTALAILAVSGAIINASGKPRWGVAVLLASVGTSATAAFLLVPGARPGGGMMMAQATAVAIGDFVGLALALLYLKRRFDAGPPLLSLARIGAALAIAVVAARVFPTGGKAMGLVTVAVVGLVYLAALIILRELGPADAAKLKRILGKK